MKRNRSLILFAAVFLCLLTGCIPQKYDKEKCAAIEKQGRALLEAYAASLPGGGEITSLYMATGYEKGEGYFTGTYLTNVVAARIETPERRLDAFVNIETGEIFTNRYMQNVDEAVERQLRPYFERAGLSGSVTVRGAQLLGSVISTGMETIHNSGKKVDTVYAYTNMLPADFTETDPEKWAESVLKNAELSGFTVSFTTETGDFPPIAFLTEFLTESGCYLKGDYEDMGRYNYRISVSTDPSQSVTGWVLDASLHDTPDRMSYSVTRCDRKTDGVFTFEYVGASGSISASAPPDAAPALAEYDCPVTAEDGTLRYRGGVGNVRLIFREEPPYTVFEKITYADGKPQEPVALSLVKLADGTYSLTDGRKINENGYRFSEEQDIRCR